MKLVFDPLIHLHRTTPNQRPAHLYLTATVHDNHGKPRTTETLACISTALVEQDPGSIQRIAATRINTLIDEGDLPDNATYIVAIHAYDDGSRADTEED